MAADVPPGLDLGWSLHCQTCRARFPFGPMVRGCPDCAARGEVGLLELQRASLAPPAPRTGRGLSRWLDMLPLPNRSDFLSLGEGGTALVPSRVIGKRLGVPELYFKLEQQNPTHSFKDRFVAVSMNAARAFGFRRVVVSSTGNLALSVAAYAAAAEMGCTIIVPRGLPANILAEANLYGARVAVIDRDLRFAALEAVSRQPDWFPLGLFLPRRVQNPFGVEGYRTFAYEVVEELEIAPAAMLFPCARGNGLYGAYKGFLDCRDAGWTTSLPRLVAAQPQGANSLEVSLCRDASEAIELPPFDSVAKSTSETVGSDDALRGIRHTGGTAVSAGEDAIRAAVVALGEEGLNVEAGSALPIACLPQLRDRGLLAGGPVVCVLTATGLRWPEQAAWVHPRVTEVASVDAFTSLLDAS